MTIVEDKNGKPLSVGRKQRKVSTLLRRALWSRDRGCSFPGCHHRRFIDAHHIRHWSDGGDTSLENLTLLCSQHHRLLHEGGFRIRRSNDSAIYYQRADGRVIPQNGYQLNDVIDDSTGDDELALAQRLAAVVHSRNPSAEVREAGGIYCAA